MNYSTLINSSDPQMVVDGMDIIKTNHLANNTFLPDSNPLKMDSMLAIKNHFDNTQLLNVDDVKTYLATSVISHCFDGWMYLAHAVDSLLKGDKGIAIHLAYYAELRGTLSFLARQGVSVNSRQHIGVNGSGIIRSSSTKGTHVDAWKYLESWMNSNTTNHNSLLNYFTVRNKSLNDWVGLINFPVSASIASQYTLEWMKEWSFDIQNYEKDHFLRNNVTYRPQRIIDNSNIDFKLKFEGILNIWKFIEPSGSDKFALLDKHLFSILFDKIHRNIIPTSSGVSLENLINDTFTAAGLSTDIPIEQIINSGINNPLLSSAKNQAIQQTSGELLPLNIISRALLMLRISSGCAHELMNSTGVNKTNIDFYLSSLGTNNGYWKGVTPSNFEVLWDDISDSVSLVDELLNEPGDIMLNDLYANWSSELHYFKQISRACFWGSCA